MSDGEWVSFIVRSSLLLVLAGWLMRWLDPEGTQAALAAVRAALP